MLKTRNSCYILMLVEPGQIVANVYSWCHGRCCLYVCYTLSCNS
uniref:Uncharacterized protein n=1 Tax=Anguilla anguilla TaxID=7936 RepID=A0A0E9WTR3_ANGAN